LTDDSTKRPRRGRTLLPVALSALAAAVALPATVALAGGGSDSAATSSGGTTLEQVQQEQAPERGDAPDRQRPDRNGHPCPEGEQGEGGSSGSATEL
jgi:hypothetical protein